jgi:hypothetical protein
MGFCSLRHVSTVRGRKSGFQAALRPTPRVSTLSAGNCLRLPTGRVSGQSTHGIHCYRAFTTKPPSRRPFRETRHNSLAVTSRRLFPRRSKTSPKTNPSDTRRAGCSHRASKPREPAHQTPEPLPTPMKGTGPPAVHSSRVLHLQAYRELRQPTNPSRTWRASTRVSQWPRRRSLKELRPEDRLHTSRHGAHPRRVSDLVELLAI